MPEATRTLEHALDLCRMADMPVYVPLVGAPLGLVQAMGGRVAEGVALTAEAVQRAEARRQVALLAWTLLRSGEAHVFAGNQSEAGEILERALALFREHGERGGEAYAQRALAEVAQREGDLDRSMRLYSQGHTLAQDLRMRPLAARCELGIGTVSTRQSAGDSSRMACAISEMAAMGMRYWIEGIEPGGAG